MEGDNVTYKDYGKVKILKHVATDRGGLVLILVRLPQTNIFAKRSRNTFWVRAGELSPA